MSKTVFHALIACSFATLATAGANPTLILDDFDADPNDDAGGAREFNFSIYEDPFNLGGSFNIATDAMFGADQGGAIFNSNAGAEHILALIYNNNGAGLNIDAVAMGWLGFELDFAFVDQDFNASIRLNTSDGSGTTIAQESFVVSASTSPQTVSLALADFDIIGSAFDPTDLDQITLILNPVRIGTPALNFIFTEFRAVVPTPGSSAMLAMGGLFASRRRR